MYIVYSKAKCHRPEVRRQGTGSQLSIEGVRALQPAPYNLTQKKSRICIKSVEFLAIFSLNF